VLGGAYSTSPDPIAGFKRKERGGIGAVNKGGRKRGNLAPQRFLTGLIPA